MAGLYIHIPFCKKACAYCNFHFDTNFKTKTEVVKAIGLELQLRKNELNTPLQTIYFGGGTPSVLSKEELTYLFKIIHREYDTTNCKEITFEVNPDDATPDNLDFWFSIGINRLSMGVQSFFEADLAYMGRFHKAEESIQAIENLNASLFNNYTIDLIYGSPTLTDDMWLQNLDFAKRNNIPHISSYALTVEPDTKLSYRIQKTKQKKPLDEDASRQFNILQNWALTNGYNHYEISNLGKPSKEAVHNSNYWNGKPYLGIGPSAHSFDGTSRKWNISNNKKYIELITEHKVAYDVEVLSEIDCINETLMIRLRTLEGMSMVYFKERFGEERFYQLLKELEAIPKAYITLKDDMLRIKPKYWMLSDGIISDLFFIES